MELGAFAPEFIVYGNKSTTANGTNTTGEN